MSKNFLKLRGRIVERFGTIGAFADALGISKASVSFKLSGNRSFSKKDMIQWCDVLGIDQQDIPIYFFE